MKVFSKKRVQEFAIGTIGVLYGCTFVTDAYRFNPVSPKKQFNRIKKRARARTGRP